MSFVHLHRLNGNGRLRYSVDPETGCWVWLLGQSYGYAYMGVVIDGRKRRVRANRWFYERYYGPIPDGCDVHHHCENKLCVNPDHLEAKPGAAHQREHKLGKPLAITETERVRRQIHGRVMSRNFAAAYTKASRSETTRSLWYRRTPEERAEIGRKISEAKKRKEVVCR